MVQLKRDIDYYHFGADLLLTNDLDPVYCMVASAGLDEKSLMRWILAYMCFANSGVASKLVESKDFYGNMHQAILHNWPHGVERRHFRGKLAYDSLNYLKNFGSPEKVMGHMVVGRKTLRNISDAVQSFRGFGPWAAWKIADMAERVLCVDVDFTDGEWAFVKDPKKGVALIKYGDKNAPITFGDIVEVSHQLQQDFQRFKAPPYQDRLVNIQEIESILCKYKAHCYGTYPYGLDTIYITHTLEGWGDLAEHMANCMRSYTSYGSYDKYLDSPLLSLDECNRMML